MARRPFLCPGSTCLAVRVESHLIGERLCTLQPPPSMKPIRGQDMGRCGRDQRSASSGSASGVRMLSPLRLFKFSGRSAKPSLQPC